MPTLRIETPLWGITAARAHAAKATEILNAWSATLRRASWADVVLMAALGPFEMVNPAEILRY
jgi:hypothetical protein